MRNPMRHASFSRCVRHPSKYGAGKQMYYELLLIFKIKAVAAIRKLVFPLHDRGRAELLLVFVHILLFNETVFDR